jgi:hypothetical protein
MKTRLVLWPMAWTRAASPTAGQSGCVDERNSGLATHKIALGPTQLRALEVLFWLVLGSSYFVAPDKLVLISQILIAGLFAVSLDIALGYAGILTVGHAAFFGFGAYLAGLLAKYCALLGYLLAFLIVRGSELARLMITIGLCVLLYEAANRLRDLTGGADGLHGIKMWPLFGLFDFDLWGRTAFVYSFSVVLALFLLVRLMLLSPFGLVLRGISNNRRRMLAIGCPVDRRPIASRPRLRGSLGRCSPRLPSSSAWRCSVSTAQPKSSSSSCWAARDACTVECWALSSTCLYTIIFRTSIRTTGCSGSD